MKLNQIAESATNGPGARHGIDSLYSGSFARIFGFLSGRRQQPNS